MDEEISEDIAHAAAEVLGTAATRAITETVASSIEAVAERRGFEVVPPMRPDLAPGESVTTVPERWCEKCEQARGARRCPVCRAITVLRLEPDELAEEYVKPPFVRERDLQPQAAAPAARRARFAQSYAPPPVVEFDEDEEEELELAPPRQAAAGSSPRFSTQLPPRRSSRNQRGGQGMARQQQQQRRLRSVDYEQQDTPVRGGQRRGGRTMSAEQQLAEQWVNGQVDTHLWYSGFSALLHGCESPEDVERAANLADAAYIEMMARQYAG